MKTASSQSIVSMLVVGMFGGVLMVFVTRPIAIDASMHDVLMFMLGALGSNFTSVVSYYMGSSAGSKHANETLQAIATGTGTGQSPPAP